MTPAAHNDTINARHRATSMLEFGATERRYAGVI
jgi:hypothetical protein